MTRATGSPNDTPSDAFGRGSSRRVRPACRQPVQYRERRSRIKSDASRQRGFGTAAPDAGNAFLEVLQGARCAELASAIHDYSRASIIQEDDAEGATGKASMHMFFNTYIKAHSRADFWG
jgi:phage gp45-like